MRKAIQYGMCICFCMIFLAGCGQAKLPGAADASALSVSKDGKVTSFLVDVFDKAYYTIEELESMAVDEAAAYNAEHRTGESVPVSVKGVETPEEDGKKVVVTMEYDSPESFSDFNDSVLFYGTVSGALSRGYELNTDFTDVKSNETIAGEQAASDPERYILITSEKVRLYCPRKITHISEGAAMTEDGGVDASAAEDMVYILMK